MSPMRKLLTVEDTFLIAQRGLIVVPAILIQQFERHGDVQVELRLPDGSTRDAVLSLIEAFVVPPPKERRYECIFKTLGKEDVPIGTEIWYSTEENL